MATRLDLEIAVARIGALRAQYEPDALQRDRELERVAELARDRLTVRQALRDGVVERPRWFHA